MCGIYGITEKNYNIVSDCIKISSHRGPDGLSIWMNDKITLGHNLLSITSAPSEGKQPWITDRQNILVYNGEIFNYYEIKKNIQNKFTPKTSCDTELLAWLLENNSYEDVVNNILDSMHAFVFYNSLRNEIILSRDHAGIKPLFFTKTSSGIIFSSEIKSLLPYCKTANTIDRMALACTCYSGANFLRQTIFKGINKVMPGETMVFDLDQKKFKTVHRNLVKPLSNKKFEIEEFTDETKKAIKQSTLGLRKFGMFLSGGIDSSLIAYELKNELKSLHTFTNKMEPNVVTPNEDHNSDALVAEKFAKDFDMFHHEVVVTPDIINEVWDDSIKFMEEPRYNWNMPMYFYTNKILSKFGTVVTMAGDMGDELLGGYPGYFAKKNMPNKPKNWEDFIWIWMKKFRSPVELNVKMNMRDLHSVLCKVLPSELWNPEDIANSAMALDCVTTVSEDFFSRNDRYGMAYSMEGRFPFSSKRFMKYCLAIKSKYKIGSTIHDIKLPVKQSYRNILPGYVLEKKKTGWSVPIVYWLRHNKILHDKFKSTIKKSDGIEEIISENNYLVNDKPKVISWMLRSWSQKYNMSL